MEGSRIFAYLLIDRHKISMHSYEFHADADLFLQHLMLTTWPAIRRMSLPINTFKGF